MAILDTLPTSTNNMRWDTKNKRYVLTLDGVMNHLGEDLTAYNMTDKSANRLLDRQSLQVYNFVDEHSMGYNARRHKRRNMAKDDTLVDTIERALVGMVEYYLASAGTLASLQHGLSVEKSKTIPLYEIRGKRRIAYETELELQNAGLLYMGYYPPLHEELDTDEF